MVVSGMNLSTSYQPWSQEMSGMINLTCHEEEKVAIGDRITFKHSESVFTEVLHFKVKSEELFTYSSYDIVRIDYIGLYNTVSTPLTRLEKDIDYTYTNNVLKLNESYYDPLNVQDLSISIRYIHHPQYLVIDLKRETADTLVLESGKEVLKRLPVSFTAKRAHFRQDAENLTGDRILDNNYEEDTCNSITSNCI